MGGLQDRNASLEAKVEALIDREWIEDMFIRYFSGGLRTIGVEGFFVDGAHLDINGLVVHGFDEIRDLYRRVVADKPPREGTFHMILSNFQINVTGNEATAKFLWTQLLNDDIAGPPQLIEQGREYDKLVKRDDGEWRITKRVVIADSGTPNVFLPTWSARKDYDFLAED